MNRIVLKKEISGRILDIGGGGEGIVGRVYGPQVVAIDNRQEELDEAPDGPEKVLMDAGKLAFGDGSFDNVTAFYFFLYLEAGLRMDVLREAFRVLKPKGQLYIWDAAIGTADPVLVELDIDANGTSVHTAYGAVKDEAEQDADSYIRLAESVGFKTTGAESKNGQFRLCFKKP